MKLEFISRNERETFNLGRRIGECLSGHELILLSGWLGVGKTLLTKGIVSGLGYDEDEVNSPSFTLVNIYETARARVYHLDLWRLDNKFDIATSTNLYEILSEPAIIIVEWAEKLSDFAFDPSRKIEISIEELEGEKRRITIVGNLPERCFCEG